MKKYLLSILLVLFLISFNITHYSLSEQYYLDSFEELGIYNNLNKQETIENLDLLLKYFNYQSNLENSFFNEKEKIHLYDVRDLLTKTYLTTFFLFILLILGIIYFMNNINLKNIIKILSLSLILLVVFSLPFMLFFNSTFIAFHIVSFSNDSWLLNPATDNLIVLFPEVFFIRTVQKIFINSFVVIGFLLLIMVVLKLYIKHKYTLH